MKYVFLISITLFLVMSAGAQTATQKNSAEKELQQLMNDWMIAVKNKDEKTLNKIVAPEFKLDGTSDLERPALPRDIWMKNTLGALKIDSVGYTKMKIDVIGTTAVVRSVFYWAGSFMEKSFVDSGVIIIDTWMLRKAGWQVVSRITVD